uniref:Uncharacterized protein n=1 Tax=Alexandrium monilatum TaxID=311494 RepID=A0A7S4WDD2_9DINO
MASLVVAKSTELSLGFALLACLFAIAAKRLWLNRTWLLSLLGDLRSRLCARPEKESLLEQRVRAECTVFGLERARHLTSIATVILMFRQLLYVMSLLGDEGVTTVQELAIAYAYRILVALMSLYRSAITCRTLDAVYSLIMAILFVMALEVDGPLMTTCASPQECRISVVTLTFVWTFINPRRWLNAVWLTAIRVAHATTVSSRNISFFLLLHLGIFISVHVVDHIIMATVRAKLLAAESSMQLVAVRALLNSIYDAVVEIDGSFRLLEHYPKLSNILLHSPASSLRGAALDELIPSEEERQNFVRRMSAGSEASTRSDSGTHVAVELFSVPLRGLDERRGHLLGVREFTDIAPLALPPQREPPQTAAPLPRPTVQQLWSGTPAASARGDVRSHGSRSCGSGPSRHSGGQRAGGGESSCSTRGGGRPAAAAVETNGAVKTTLLRSTLVTWRSRRPPGACCNFHTEVAEAQRVLCLMASGLCIPQFGPDTPWQCQRCEVAAEIFRPKRPSPCCRMCEAMTSEELGFANPSTECIVAL